MEMSRNRPTSEWQYAILQGLAKFLDIPQSLDAPRLVQRPTPKAYKAAVALISDVPIENLPFPRIAPDRQGGIQFEWEKGSCAVEIAVSPNGALEVLKVDGDSEEEGVTGISRARDTLVWLAQR